MFALFGIPAYNEEATIADVIDALPDSLDGIDDIGVVVVDDGSTDRTAELAREAGAEVVRHVANAGVGAAFQSLHRYSLQVEADILITMDADGQFPAEEIPTLIRPILDGDALVCTASRFKDPELEPEMPWIKKWGNRRVANLVSMMTGKEYADVSCGFRAYAREALLRLTVYHPFTYTHETFLDLAAKRIPIREVPIQIRGVREVGESRVANSVLRYGRHTAMIMLRTYRDQWPLKLVGFFSIPFVLIGLGLLGWSVRHLYATGYWLKWAAFSAAAAIALAVALLFLGFIIDITTRLRRNQEEMIYWLRRDQDDGETL